MSERMWRWFDHNGQVIESPATEGRPTAYRWDDQYTHWMFGGPSSTPTFQALTLCGKRALEVPGRGAVNCPECVEEVQYVIWTGDSEPGSTP